LRRVLTGRVCSAPLATRLRAPWRAVTTFFRFRPWLLLLWPIRALVRHEVAGSTKVPSCIGVYGRVASGRVTEITNVGEGDDLCQTLGVCLRPRAAVSGGPTVPSLVARARARGSSTRHKSSGIVRWS
jgi:hypothetical protein